LVTRKPLVVQGVHYRALERVVVTVGSVPKQIRRVRANRAGSFRVTLGAVPVPRCGRFGIHATGSLGSFAVLRIPLPACSTAALPGAAVGAQPG
jgi:hypothetical protein